VLVAGGVKAWSKLFRFSYRRTSCRAQSDPFYLFIYSVPNTKLPLYKQTHEDARKLPLHGLAPYSLMGTLIVQFDFIFMWVLVERGGHLFLSPEGSDSGKAGYILPPETGPGEVVADRDRSEGSGPGSGKAPPAPDCRTDSQHGPRGASGPHAFEGGNGQSRTDIAC